MPRTKLRRHLAIVRTINPKGLFFKLGILAQRVWLTRVTLSMTRRRIMRAGDWNWDEISHLESLTLGPARALHVPNGIGKCLMFFAHALNPLHRHFCRYRSWTHSVETAGRAAGI